MIKEWKGVLIYEFENGYRVSVPYIKSIKFAIGNTPIVDVLGPNNEYLTSNFLPEGHGNGLTADEIADLIYRVKSIKVGEIVDIL